MSRTEAIQAIDKILTSCYFRSPHRLNRLITVRSIDARSTSIEYRLDASREILGTRKERVMASGKIDNMGACLDSSALHLRRRGKILRADDVGGGLVSPRDLARGLREWRVRRTRACSVVLSSQSCKKYSRIMSGSTPMVPSSPGCSHGAGSEPVSSAWDSPASGMIEVTYTSWVTFSSAPASVMTIPP